MGSLGELVDGVSQEQDSRGLARHSEDEGAREGGFHWQQTMTDGASNVWPRSWVGGCRNRGWCCSKYDVM